MRSRFEKNAGENLCGLSNRRKVGPYKKNLTAKRVSVG